MTKSPSIQANEAILNLYSRSNLKWYKNTVFAAVEMDGCVIYTPCSHIRENHRLNFKNNIERLYEISKNNC